MDTKSLNQCYAWRCHSDCKSQGISRSNVDLVYAEYCFPHREGFAETTAGYAWMCDETLVRIVAADDLVLKTRPSPYLLYHTCSAGNTLLLSWKYFLRFNFKEKWPVCVIRVKTWACWTLWFPECYTMYASKMCRISVGYSQQAHKLSPCGTPLIY